MFKIAKSQPQWKIWFAIPGEFAYYTNSIGEINMPSSKIETGGTKELRTSLG